MPRRGALTMEPTAGCAEINLGEKFLEAAI